MERCNLYQAHSLSRIHADWSCLVGEYHRLGDRAFRAEVFGFATQIMEQAKSYLGQIVEGLHRAGCRFVDPGKVWQRSDPAFVDWMNQCELQGIFLPISLQAWLAVVGTVDLRGTHPSWPKPAYLFEDVEPTNDVLYTDPLVVECAKDYPAYQRREWEISAQEEGIEHVGPFKIAIAPDHIHKANLSGGPPYEVQADSPKVDSLLLNERHCTSFTSYIRLSLRWGGFPGLEYIDSPNKTSHGPVELLL